MVLLIKMRLILTMSIPLLTIKDLTISFQTEKGLIPALKSINLEIQRGETVALVGESGGGKTMTGLAMLQLLPTAARVSEQSQILLEETDLLQLSELAMQKIRGRRIGMIFQEAMVAFNPVFTIEDQIEEVLKKHFRQRKKKRHAEVLRLLSEVGLRNPEQIAAAYPHQLSGGQRQRAMIAMALAGRPDILVADEPTTAVDVTIQAQILKLLKELQQKYQMSILFITHDLGVVAEIADRVLVLYQGQIVEAANKKNFFAAPQHDYSKKLFAALPENQTQLDRVQTPEAKNLLMVKDLQVYFPIKKGLLKRTVGYIKAVDDINFNLAARQTVALIGESGSGKTTAGRAIVRLIKPTAGSIQFLNHDLSRLSNAAMRSLRPDLQMIFQDPFSSLNPRMMIGDIIAEGLVAQKKGDNKARRERVSQLLIEVGLPVESQWRYPHEFSGGQRQRICIARALALEPKLIVCDEPTSSLDVFSQMQILQLMRQLQEKLGLSYLLITHNFAVVAYIADYVAVMQQGKIVEQGEVKQVLDSPIHPYTQSLLAAIPKARLPQVSHE